MRWPEAVVIGAPAPDNALAELCGRLPFDASSSSSTRIRSTPRWQPKSCCAATATWSRISARASSRSSRRSVPAYRRASSRTTATSTRLRPLSRDATPPDTDPSGAAFTARYAWPCSTRIDLRGMRLPTASSSRRCASTRRRRVARPTGTPSTGASCSSRAPACSRSKRPRYRRGPHHPRLSRPLRRRQRAALGDRLARGTKQAPPMPVGDATRARGAQGVVEVPWDGGAADPVARPAAGPGGAVRARHQARRAAAGCARRCRHRSHGDAFADTARAPIASASTRSKCTWRTAICCTSSFRRIANARTDALRRIVRQSRALAARGVRCGARRVARRTSRSARESRAPIGWTAAGRSTNRSSFRGGWCARGCDWIDCSSGGVSPAQKIPLGPGYQVPLARANQARDRCHDHGGRHDHRARAGRGDRRSGKTRTWSRWRALFYGIRAGRGMRP